EPLGPWVLPGDYTVRLRAGGKSYEQPLTIKMDPRVKAQIEELVQQFALSMGCYNGMRQARAALTEVRGLRAKLKESRTKTEDKALIEALGELDRKAALLEGAERRRRERPAEASPEPTLARLAGEQERLMELLQGADVAPTTQAV